MRLVAPSLVVLGKTRMERPPRLMAAPRMKSSLPADARVEVIARRLGGHLARKIHLQGAADGDHVVVLGDLQGVVDLVAGQEQKVGVKVHVVVHGPGADAKGADRPGRADGFFCLAVDHPAVDQGPSSRRRPPRCAGPGCFLPASRGPAGHRGCGHSRCAGSRRPG